MKLFRSMYVKIVSFFALLTAKWAASMLRRLIVLQGKDPDYEAPPATPHFPRVKSVMPLTSEYIAEKLSKYYSASRGQYVSWKSDYIHDRSKHPVLQSRQQLEKVNTIDIVDVKTGEGEPLTPKEAAEIIKDAPNSNDPVWAKEIQNVANGDGTNHVN